MQLDAFAATQLDGGQSNRVRTSRRSSGKHTMRPIVGRRRAEQFVYMQFGPTQFELRGAIELPDDDEVRKTLDIGESRLKLRQDREHTICVVFSPRPLGTSLASLYGLLTNPIG